MTIPWLMCDYPTTGSFSIDAPSKETMMEHITPWPSIFCQMFGGLVWKMEVWKMFFLFQWLISGSPSRVALTFMVSIRITYQIRSGAAMEIGESEGIGVNDRFAILYWTTGRWDFTFSKWSRHRLFRLQLLVSNKSTKMNLSPSKVKKRYWRNQSSNQ